MDFPTIIDNQSEETSLSTVLSRAILPYTARMQVAVGYFYYSGFQLLAPALRQNPLFSLFQAPPHSPTVSRLQPSAAFPLITQWASLNTRCIYSSCGGMPIENFGNVASGSWCALAQGFTQIAL